MFLYSNKEIFEGYKIKILRNDSRSVYFNINNINVTYVDMHNVPIDILYDPQITETTSVNVINVQLQNTNINTNCQYFLLIDASLQYYHTVSITGPKTLSIYNCSDIYTFSFIGDNIKIILFLNSLNITNFPKSYRTLKNIKDRVLKFDLRNTTIHVNNILRFNNMPSNIEVIILNCNKNTGTRVSLKGLRPNKCEVCDYLTGKPLLWKYFYNNGLCKYNTKILTDITVADLYKRLD